MSGGATGPELLEQRMQATFGMSHREYRVETTRHPAPKAYLNNAIRIVERSGVLPQLKKWDQGRRKSNAGAKPIIPLSAVLVLFLLNVQMGFGITYHQLARTLDLRCTREQFTLLGIRDAPGDHDDWYQRIWSASARMLSLIDPYPAPRDRILNAEQYAQLLERQKTPEAVEKSTRNLQRIDWVCNQLIVASVHMLPADIWARYKGNLVIDATRGRIAGRPNPTNDALYRTNPDPLSRRYRREENHDGHGAKTDEPAYELETGVMGWNTPGANTQFPSLITAVSFHNPGELSGHAVKLIKLHQKLGFHRIIVIADRAYNGEAIENFHVPARKLGCELVVDYKVNELGAKGYYQDLIMLDGNWHVNWIPDNLIAATAELAKLSAELGKAKETIRIAAARKKPATKAQLAELEAAKSAIAEEPLTRAVLRQRVANRASYRMVPKGLPDSDGFQRFSYPTGVGDLTKAGAASKGKSITIPMLIPEEESTARKRRKTQPIKFLQKLPYGTKEWHEAYGVRSLVESSNNLIKLASAEDIGNPKKRSGRGYAFHYLAMTLASVSSNIRRIVTFFEAEAKRTTKGKRHRARFRKAREGTPLPRRQEPAPLATPQ